MHINSITCNPKAINCYYFLDIQFLLQLRLIDVLCSIRVFLQDDLGGGDSEEAVSVDWAERCINLAFRCPCGKGYEVLLSENNCYYKLM